MTPQSKQEWEEQRAREALDNWQTCPLHELEAACEVFDGGLLLLIARYAQTLT